ncbi:MAG: phosphoglycerate kinase [Bacilli bacterium]|nr:phosphoglycerate kinase [Bacilli bacterium]
MKTIENINLQGKKVILRSDLNVTIKDGKIIDDTRIKASLKTIEYILNQNAKLLIMSHLGKVKTEEDKEKNDMRIVYDRLNELLPDKVSFINDTNYKNIEETLSKIDYGKALLMQNTRYEDLVNKKESNCDEELARNWASLGDIFINDAFGTIHRKHASNYGISCYLPSAIGFLIQEELDHLNILDNPEKPFIVIMGGAKVSDKVEIIDSMMKKADYILIGGAMANTFLKAKGYEIGSSLYEEEAIVTCKELFEKYDNRIILPVDFFGKTNDKKELENLENISKDFQILDIGTETINNYKKLLQQAKTAFWNGPLGLYEEEDFRYGTKEILEYIKDNVKTVILGGGDIVSASNILGYTKDITFASTGGGATLEYLSNHKEPGLINME